MGTGSAAGSAACRRSDSDLPKYQHAADMRSSEAPGPLGSCHVRCA